MKTHRQKNGFTLLELLVVMTIIAILAGAIFATAGYALKKARIVQAQNIAVGLANGVNNFHSEYRRWPRTTSNPVNTGTDTAFISDLLGRDTSANRINKRNINFLDNIPPARGNPPVGGIVYEGTGGRILDPWEGPFFVYIRARMETEAQPGEMPNPEGGDPLRIRVAVFSPGQDGEASGTVDGVDATKDNVRSW